MSIEEEEDASLKELVTKTLHSNGVLGKIQAQLRASVFLALEEEFRDKGIPLVSPPTQQVLGTREGAVAASLVQDFLQCLGLDFSLSVFSPESGHSSFWSYPGGDALSSSLGLRAGRKGTQTTDEKGTRTPLLIELLRERESLPLSVEQNGGEDNSITSNSSSSSSREQQSQQQQQKSLQGKDNAARIHSYRYNIDDDRQDNQTSPNLPALNIENGRKVNEAVNASTKQPPPPPPPLGDINIGKSSCPELLDHTSDDTKPDSDDTSVNGEDKQYEDDFSSLSEKEGDDEDDDNEDLEEEVDEDIEEDLDDISADDLLNSSASGVSDITKDQSLSQASNPPAYQEDL